MILALWARQKRLSSSLVADGTTVLLTTQYLEQADRLAHRIAVIDGGRVIAEGTSAELKAGLGATVVEVGWVVGILVLAAPLAVRRYRRTA
ncbi:MAG TPA: hypothetical protein VHF24_14620 [Acidimicrobiales bacterium]|nr:hypothetical protein [Acidimicrobiales bacterium]